MHFVLLDIATLQDEQHSIAAINLLKGERIASAMLAAPGDEENAVSDSTRAGPPVSRQPAQPARPSAPEASDPAPPAVA